MAQPTTRMTMMAACIAAPAILAACGLTAIEAYRAVDPAAPIFGAAPASLADAITGGYGVEYGYRFIHAGQGADAPIAVGDPDYTGGRTVMVSPLMLAIAARDSNAVLMLISAGARFDLPQNRFARCLARDICDREVIAILDHYGVDPPGACPDRASAAAIPLLRWLD